MLTDFWLVKSEGQRPLGRSRHNGRIISNGSQRSRVHGCELDSSGLGQYPNGRLL
jgi:hypothetical protein